MSFRPAPHKSFAARGFAAAQVNRLTGGWGLSLGAYSQSPDAELRYSRLRTMRARARDLYQNNDYAKKFIKLVITNVVGPKGITFQSKVKNADGKLDNKANERIEAAWADWSHRGNCDVTGRFSWPELQRVVVSAVARDGECLVRIVRGFPNKHRFALQVIEADHLDEDYNGFAGNGNEIRMGVEVDRWGRAAAYHIRVQHPGDYVYQRGSNHYQRIAAEEMLHIFVVDRPGQNRGVPWMHTAMTRLNNMGSYEEAVLVAARTGASKMGFLIPPVGEVGGEEYEGDGETDDGDLISEVEPGILEKLPAGYDFKTFDPGQPTGEFDPFMKRTLHGVSAGFNVAYHSLSGDLEGVSYSSIRSGSIEERDEWRVAQAWFIDSLPIPVFSAFLDIQLLTQMIPLPYEKLDKFNAPQFRPRGWLWVDPQRDANASILSINNGLTTRTAVVAEQGEDFEELVEQLAAEQAILKRHGVTLASPGIVEQSKLSRPEEEEEDGKKQKD